MNYQTFVQKCMEIVTTSRIEQVQHSKQIKVVQRPMPRHLQPSNVHFQVYMRSKTSCMKLQEWSFVTCKTLMKSINCEDNESDPELDSIETYQQNFFQILRKLLSNVSPRLLIKVLQPHTLQFALVGNQQDLVPFDGDNTFVIKVGDYEGNNFQCNVSLKYNYQYQTQQEEEEDYHSEVEDSCEFELLIDPAYEKKRKQEQALLQNRKYSENVFHQRQFSPPPQVKPSSKSAHDVRIQIQEQPLIKNSGLSKIAALYKQIDFKDRGLLRGSTLEQFLAL